MLTIIILVIFALAAIAGLLVFGFVSYVKSQGRKKTTVPALGAEPVASDKTGTCASCGEKRIIVNQDDTLCASCYSALRTKKLG